MVTLEQPPKGQPSPQKQPPQGNHKGLPLQGWDKTPRSRVSLRGNALLDALRHEPADLHYFIELL